MTGGQSLHMPRIALIKAVSALLPGMRMTSAPLPDNRQAPDVQYRRCTNLDCGRPYRITRCAERSVGHSAGRLHCPHCGHVEALWEGDRFSLHPLTAEQEALFETRFPSAA